MTGKKLILDQTLTDIADAIRAKTGDEDLITPPEMPEKIESIKGEEEAPIVLLTDGATGEATTATVKTVGSVRPTSLLNMFTNWAKLASLDMSGLDATDVQNITNIFSGCSLLHSIVFPSSGFPSAIGASGAFQSCGLTSIQMKDLKLNSVQNISNIFFGCSNLRAVDFTDTDLSGVTNMSGAFRSCNSITAIDLSGTNLNSVKTISNMCNFCPGLVTIDLSNVDFSAVTSVSAAFTRCDNLENIITNENTVFPSVSMLDTFSSCPKLSVQSVRNIFNALPTVTGMTIKLHATTYNRLSADDIAIATDKGWTVTH